MTRERRQITALLAVEVVVIAALLALALDIRAHASVQDLGGVNVWGYRGPVARQRQPNEIRIVVVGGTRAFGWGEPGSALVSHLRRIIMLTTDRPGRPLRPVEVINLARLGALPDTYSATLAHHAYLRPDYVCVYDDLGERGAAFDPNSSAVLALTGYQPALPVVLREKGMAWRFGDVSRGYGAARSGVGADGFGLREAGGAVIETVGSGLAAIDRAAGHAIAGAPKPVDETPQTYANQMTAAIDSAHTQAEGVVLVLSPVESGAQAARRRALLSRVNRAAAWLRVVDLDGQADLKAPAMRIDGWNYGSAAIVRTAEVIAPAFVSLIPDR
jgi:hypothetical protein